jgi:alpha-D-xyloside xylohydrolase
MAQPNDFLTVDSGPLQARLHKASGHVELAGPDRVGAPHANVLVFNPATAQVGAQTLALGQVITATPLPAGLDLVQQFGAATARTRLSFPFAAVMRYEVLDWGANKPDSTQLSAISNGNEHFYGFGEKFNSLDQAGKVVDMLTFDNPGDKGDRSYKVSPWFISTRGYGFHLDSTAQSTFDMRVATGRYAVTNHFGSLAFNVVYGPVLTDVLSRYTAYIGRPALPPPWAFGAWISSDIWRDGGEVRYAVEKFRARKIPVSAVVFDSPWEVAYNDFKFNIGDPNTTQFGHPGTYEDTKHDGFATVAEMMSFLQKSGLKAICWMTPFVNITSTEAIVPGQRGEAQPDGMEDRFFVQDATSGHSIKVPWWKGTGRPIDFTLQAARDWLTDRLKALLAESLVDTASGKEPAIGGFKTDDGEARTNGDSKTTPNGEYIPDNARFADGRSPREMLNGYCLSYLKTVWNVLGEKGLIFARSGTAGTQAFSGCWAGDNQPNFGEQDGLPSVIVAGLSAAMSGFSIWGHDVGGYLNANFSPVSAADLFIRWTQFGCFSPIMQMHRQVNKDDERQYPWGYLEHGEDRDHNRALENYRFYATLHTRLFPYLYTYAKQSRDTGLPILRPLVLLHPDDPATVTLQHTYYFGGELIVAPVFDVNANKRQVYLPEGTWFDFWTNERHTGNQTIDWTNPAQPDVPKSKIPVFVRNGAIVPLILGDDVQTLCDANYVNNSAIVTWADGLDVRIYPSGSSRFTIFDGTDIQFDSGARGKSVTVNSATARPILLRILSPKPAEIRRDGAAVTEFAAQAPFDAAPEGWQFDAARGVVLIKFNHPSGTTGLTL